jgi:phosphoribosyl 1,2-cyclic phosphodiesterase
MQVYALASGSSGNAMVVQTSQGCILIDAGIPQRTLLHQLAQVGITPTMLRGIVVTHEHGDHTTSVLPLAKKHHLPLIGSAGTFAALNIPAALTTVVVAHQQCLEFAGLQISAVRVKHDAAEPIAVSIRHADVAITVATDLGSWDDSLVAACAHSQLVVIEANHERERLSASRYDQALKLRIASPIGHLDNIQAGEFLACVLRDRAPRDIWLAHLSHEANTPHLAVRSVHTVLNMRSCGDSARSIVALPRHGTVAWGPPQRSHQQQLWD